MSITGTLNTLHPAAAAVYFLLTAGIVMFSMNPVILTLSLVCSVMLYVVKQKKANYKSHLFSLLLFAVMAIINPLVNHNGTTVLFIMNDNPITLEALIYGVFSAAMIISVLYWFRSFTQIMTSDKLLCIFGGLSPRLALVLSMALRFVPMFGKQAEKTGQVQKAMGLYKDDNISDTFKGRTGVFNIIVTWGLENGIITADSMTARGYGCGKRTSFSLFRWKSGDTFFKIITAVFFSAAAYGLYCTDYAYYPGFYISDPGISSVTGYISYGLLAFFPVILEAKEALQWKYLKSKI